MRWFFKKIFETTDEFVYAYSRESREFDGEIRISKKTGEARMNRPSGVDADSPFSQKAACSKAYRLKSENFPETMNICCG